MQSKRVYGRSDIRKLLKEGRSLRGEWFTLKVLPTQRRDSRFGCAVRRSACRMAVLRNRLKRWLREAFRRNQKLFPPGYDIAAVVFKAPVKASYSSIEQALLTTWDRFIREGP